MRDAKNELLETFHLFDQSKKGYITLEDLQRVAKEVNCGNDANEINYRQMIDFFDKDKDGCINFDEFKCIMRNSRIS